MALYLVMFEHDGEPRRLHLSAESFEDAVDVVDSIRRSAHVEGLVWAKNDCVSRGRLN